MNSAVKYGHESAWLTISNKYFMFSVQTCSNAYLALTLTPHDVTQEAYEVVLGASDNTKYVHTCQDYQSGLLYNR